jgi:glycosyltransferase involved in cell wall biosynthesis
MSRPALLIGSEWLPNQAGGLNRYFHGLCGAVGRADIPASALVTFLRQGQTGPIPLRPMAHEGAGLLTRLHGARMMACEAMEQGIALANPHFALYSWPWLRELPDDVPLVVNFHGPWADEMLAERRDLRYRLKAAVARTLEMRVYRRADRCITLSGAFRDVLVERYGVPRRRVSVIPGGADLSPFLDAPARSEARSSLGWPENRPIVLCVRRLTRRMGVDMLIKAAVELRSMVPDVLVFIAGRGHAEADLHMLASSLELEQTVRFLGFMPDDRLPLAYAASDVSVVPSAALEGFGLIIVESLASGTPAIVTPVGGMPEVLSGFPGLVTKAPNSSAIAESLHAALTARDGLPARAECRAYALRFGWDCVLPRIMSVWRDAGWRTKDQ